MTRAAELIKQIELENGVAEEYLLTGRADGSTFAQAVEIIEDYLSPACRCLLDARREIEKSLCITNLPKAGTYQSRGSVSRKSNANGGV